VGAPPEVATLLEEIGRERRAAAAAGGEVGVDPELDEFMVRQALTPSAHQPSYCTSRLSPVLSNSLRCYYM
jgi:hypothetical protein